MDKEPITNDKVVFYITQYRYAGQGMWFDRLNFTSLEIAKNDLVLAKKWAKNGKMKYKYRLIRRETTVQEFVEET